MAKGKGQAAMPAKVKKSAEQTVKDAMFGQKNKGGSQAKKLADQLLRSAAAGNEKSEAGKAARAAEERKREKLAQEEAKRELNALLNKPAQVQKAPFGVDPKTILCIFFKKGDCEKGNKCKFSHDINIERKTIKKDIYQDTREVEEEAKKQETSDDWDEEKLRNVVLSKKGNQQTTTEKVCKFFITAIEDGKYGWFWVCPNGGDKCKYKHALPPGFVLKTKEQRAAEKALLDKSPLKTLTLEEFLESERHKLTGNLTPVTPETFATWKKGRMEKKAAEEELRKAKDATGRALFESGNWRTVDGDDEADDDEDDGVWNLERMRKETEQLRAKKEEERLAAEFGGPVNPDVYGGVTEAQAEDGEPKPSEEEPKSPGESKPSEEEPKSPGESKPSEEESKSPEEETKPEHVPKDEPPADDAVPPA